MEFASSLATPSAFDLLIQLEARVRHARMDVVAGQAQTWVGLAFRLRNHWYVAPREDVREVIVPPRMTRVPGTQSWLLGVANVRGSLLPISDLGAMLGEAPSAAERAARVLVFNSEQVPAGLLVDEVAGYRQFAPADQKHELCNTAGSARPFLLGGFVRDARPWLVLSLRKLAESQLFIDGSPVA